MAESENKYDSAEKETLNLINSEMNTFYCQVQKTNPSLKCLSEAAKPFLHRSRKPKRQNSTSLLTQCSLLIGLLSLLAYCFVYYDPVYRFVKSSSRNTFKSLIPLWDWRWVHNVQCFMSNPFKLSSQEAETEDCNHCLNMTGIERLNNTGESLLEQITSYLNEDIPVIIENVTESWPNRGLIDVENLKQLYLDDEVMRLFMCCDFESNIPVTHGNHRTLLRLLVEEKRTNYYAHWQNCFKESAKLFRQVYKRPEFLPSTVELANTNWVFISSNYAPKESKYIRLPMDDVFMMLIQLEGHMDVFLESVRACHKICHPLHFRLTQGSVLILTDFLYTAKYVPSGDEESITVGLGGSLDQ